MKLIAISWASLGNFGGEVRSKATNGVSRKQQQKHKTEFRSRKLANWMEIVREALKEGHKG